MGVAYSNPQFQATNYVLDYSVNVMRPDRYGMVMQRLGPNVNSFPPQGQNQVLSDFNDCLNGSPELAAEYRKLRNMTWAALAIFAAAFIAIFALTAYAAASSIAGVLIVGACVVCIGVFCVVNVKGQRIAHEWRSAILAQLLQKVSIWKAMYPAFTFSIIYPVEVWRRVRRSGSHSRSRRYKNKLVAIWVYVRVTQGPCQTGSNEPIYATSTNVVGAAQGIQPVMMQPQMMQPQAMMVQQPNGQFVQGTPAIMNGQQVIVVQQPPQQMVMAQPMQQQYVNQGYTGEIR